MFYNSVTFSVLHKKMKFFQKKCPLLLQNRNKAVPLHSLSGSNAADEAVKP